MTLAVIRRQSHSVRRGDIIAGGIVLTSVIFTFIYVQLTVLSSVARLTVTEIVQALSGAGASIETRR